MVGALVARDGPPERLQVRRDVRAGACEDLGEDVWAKAELPHL